MASKVTPLYAQTRILLNLWYLDDRTPVAKKHFFPGKPYGTALNNLVEEESIRAEKVGRHPRYAITETGETKLAAALANEEFGFSSSIGAKTTNAILKWLRQHKSSETAPIQVASPVNAPSNGHKENGHSGKVSKIVTTQAVMLEEQDYQ